MIENKDSRIINGYRNYLNFYLFVFLIISILGFKNEDIKQSELLISTQARIAVEKAWDTYHHGALGGTLPSPVIQTNLEKKLHICRELLAEAYEAEDNGNIEKTKNLISKILIISNNVIKESQVHKK